MSDDGNEVDVPSIDRARENRRLKSLLTVIPGGGRGHPMKLVFDERTLKQLTGAGRIGCTQRETAAVLGVTEQTLMTFFGDWPEAKEAWEMAAEGGKASLRRKQMDVALKGNPIMLIWMGKQRLNQSDKIEAKASVTLESLVLASVRDDGSALKGQETPQIDAIPADFEEIRRDPPDSAE